MAKINSLHDLLKETRVKWDGEQEAVIAKLTLDRFKIDPHEGSLDALRWVIANKLDELGIPKRKIASWSMCSGVRLKFGELWKAFLARAEELERLVATPPPLQIVEIETEVPVPAIHLPDIYTAMELQDAYTRALARVQCNLIGEYVVNMLKLVSVPQGLKLNLPTSRIVEQDLKRKKPRVILYGFNKSEVAEANEALREAGKANDLEIVVQEEGHGNRRGTLPTRVNHAVVSTRIPPLFKQLKDRYGNERVSMVSTTREAIQKLFDVLSRYASVVQLNSIKKRRTDEQVAQQPCA